MKIGVNKEFICVCFAIVIIQLSFGAYKLYASSLDDFKDDVKKERSSSSSSSRKRSSSGGSAEESSSDNILGEIFAYVIGSLAEHNMKTGYDEYPYDEASSEQEVYSSISQSTPDGRHANKQFVSYDHKKKWMYEATAAYQYIPDGTHAAQASLHGKFLPLLGPELYYKHYRDSDESLHHYRIGINYTLFQQGWFLFDTYVQAAGMSEAVDLFGAAFGFQLGIYPFDPLVLKMRHGWELYDDIAFYNTELRAGIMFDRVELFAGYEWFYSQSATMNGFKLGVTGHF